MQPFFLIQPSYCGTKALASQATKVKDILGLTIVRSLPFRFVLDIARYSAGLCFFFQWKWP
jgi:hypothetical protein